MWSTGLSRCQARDPGALNLLRQLERISRVEHCGSLEIKMAPKKV